MDNKADLKDAIHKAIENGWHPAFVGATFTDGEFNFGRSTIPSFRDVIYDHGFAKALWGEDKRVGVDAKWGEDWHGWQYHLQQMVISPDPIKYLGENI